MTREILMQGEETRDGEESGFSQSLILEAINRDLNFDPEKISQVISRSLCEPTDSLYRRSPALKNDPFKAMGEVKLTGISEDEIKDPVEGLLIGAAKLETAKHELNLSPKQKEAFDGVMENIHGAIAWAGQNKTVRKALIGAEVVGLTLSSAGCVNAINTPTEISPTASPIVETPAVGEALTVGLLNAEMISNLPEGEVKKSLQAELISVKEECAQIPGCMTDTVQIYRVIVPDNVFSIRFANFDTGTEPMHTEILSIMNGGAQSAETINKDLLTKEVVIDGVTTRIFGYVDDNGVSHPILVNSKTTEGDKFQIFDVEGHSYDIITKNAQEMQALSHLWEDPSFVVGNALPTPTKEATPTPEESTLYHVMTPEEMETRNLFGYGVEINAEVEGIPTTVYFVQTDQLVNKFKEAGYSPLFLNPMMGEISDMDSAQRITRAVRIADYEGYLQDKGLKNEDYSFGQYLEDLKKGIDRSYVIYSLNNKIIVDPTKTHEFVIGHGMELKNGDTFPIGPGNSIGVQYTIDGGIREIFLNNFFDGTYQTFQSKTIDKSKEREQAVVAGLYNVSFKQTLEYLSFPELAQQGKPVEGDMYYMQTNLDKKLISSPMFIELNNLVGDQIKEFSQKNNIFWIDIVN